MDSNGLTLINWKCCVLEVDIEYPKQLHKLHNDYPLNRDKIEIKEGISKYQVLIPGFHNIPIGNVKISMPNFCDNKNICFIMKTCNLVWD